MHSVPYILMFPIVLASHLVRSSKPGEIHGGLYLADFNNKKYKCIMDWSDPINWQGRGADRGLRGVSVVDKNTIYVLTSRSLLLLDGKFRVVKRFENEYLLFCHEIWRFNNKLFIASTGYDSIISFNLNTKKFDDGFCVRGKLLKRFNPNQNGQLKDNDTMHINNVYADERGIFFCGTSLDKLYRIKNNNVEIYCNSPKGTHNCRPFNSSEIIYNDTKRNCTVIRKNGGGGEFKFPIKVIPRQNMTSLQGNDAIAKQPFARGLVVDKGYIINGSSPALLSCYDISSKKKVKEIKMSNDIRVTIHGMAVYE